MLIGLTFSPPCIGSSYLNGNKLTEVPTNALADLTSLAYLYVGRRVDTDKHRDAARITYHETL